MLNGNKICVFIHLYYQDTFKDIYLKSKHFLTNPEVDLFINLDYENPAFHRLEKIIKWKFPQAIVIKTPNKGKDIGAKLVLINMYQKMEVRADWLLFLHDKKSPQIIDGDKWKEKLFSIVEESKKPVLASKMKDEKVGMIGAKGFLTNRKNELEDEIFMGNKEKVFQLAKKYNLESGDYGFIAGTMFWVKASIFEDFFTKYSAIEIRKDLEAGNVMDNFGTTFSHSWERLFGWMVTTYGYTLTEI